MTMKWGEPEYYVVRTGHHTFSVAKFTDSFAPEHVYTVRWESCTCPIGFDCKHVQLTKAYIERGEPPMWIWHPLPNGKWTGEPVKALGGENVT